MARLKNFFNNVSKNNRIYTAEEIGRMSTNEFCTHEKAIDYQLANLGIPKQSDLAGNSDVVYVQAYTKDDGTEVKAHYRSKSDDASSEVLTGGISYTEQSPVLKGSVTHYDFKKPPQETTDTNLYDASMGAINKSLLDCGINIVGSFKKENDAVNMWNMASDNKNSPDDYINQNGKIFSGAESLDSEYDPYKGKIKEKIKSQFGAEDVPGFVMHENSSAAIEINKSSELKNFINENLESLQAGKEVTGSMGFSSNENLYHAFGKVDVLSAKMKDGYVDVTILDTYDFNKDDKNWKVQMGYAAQKAKLLNPYFTIVKCRYKL